VHQDSYSKERTLPPPTPSSCENRMVTPTSVINEILSVASLKKKVTMGSS